VKRNRVVPIGSSFGHDLASHHRPNHFDNALRYSGAGATIHVECRPETCGDQITTVLRALDNGPGVPPEARHRIFDRFYRVPGSGRQGSGIGLSLVARVAQMAGATIELDSGLDGRGLAVAVRFRH
jgi:signal transduction histidine kinase